MQARAYRLKKRLPEDQKAYLNDLKETDPATYTAFLAVLDKQGANPFDLAPLTPPTGVLQAALTVAPASETGKALLARFDAQVKSNQTIAQDAVQANAESYRTLVGALTQEDSRRHELSMKMTEVKPLLVCRPCLHSYSRVCILTLLIYTYFIHRSALYVRWSVPASSVRLATKLKVLPPVFSLRRRVMETSLMSLQATWLPAYWLAQSII